MKRSNLQKLFCRIISLQNMLLDHISDLYFKIANSALMDNNIGIYKEYLSKHENIFGVDHFRTKAMYQSFLKNN